MNRDRFEALVEHTLQCIPETFRCAMGNVVILIDDWPTRELMNELYGDADTYVYGMFTGTPLPEQHVQDFGDLPAQIQVFQGALEHDFEDPAELERELKITLIHEIAHYMGFDEEQLEALGYG